MSGRLGLTSVALVAIGAAVWPLPPSTAPRRSASVADSVTFAKDIAPILYENCVACHRPGGSAPFSLLTYEDARAQAAPMVQAVTSGRMPPWLPAPDRGRFAGDRRLEPREIALLEQWVAQGAPRGDPRALPPAPAESGEWVLGAPDLVVAMPEPYTLPAGGGETFRNFVIPVPVATTRYVRAVEIQPGNPAVVHHANLMVDAQGVSRRLDVEDTAPGFDGMHGGTAQMPQGFFLGWTPGRLPFEEPPGFAWQLDPGTDLVLQLHLRPGAQAEVIQGRIGLYFTSEPPSRVATALRLAIETIDIPPGDSNYVVEDAYRLPVDVQVLGVYPHAHYLARDMQVFARLPDGSTEWLLHIPAWDFNWQDVYQLAEPISLPRGSVLWMRLTYDNSARNPLNPHSPPQRVVYGPHSTDEMGDVWIRVAPADQEALARLNQDFETKDLQTRLAGLQAMAQRDPNHPYANRELGNLMLSFGMTPLAVRYYRQHLAAFPGDGNTHYNLGIALESEGEGDSAFVHYRATLETIPAHAEAHFRLGLALTDSGRIATAVEHLRRAVQLEPEWPSALIALAWNLVTATDSSLRDVPEAVRLAETATELTAQGDPAVLNVLAAAYAAAGAFDRAVPFAERALALAQQVGSETLVAEIQRRLTAYREERTP